MAAMMFRLASTWLSYLLNSDSASAANTVPAHVRKAVQIHV
jgi:hypothetical protein